MYFNLKIIAIKGYVKKEYYVCVMKYNFFAHDFFFTKKMDVSISCLPVWIDISKFSGRRQKVACQTIFAINVGVITRDIGDSGCKLQIVLNMY